MPSNKRENKGLESALRESNLRLQAIIETAVEGIITINEQGIVESINPAACRIFGYTSQEIVGRNISVLMPSPDREKHDEYLSNYLRTGQAKIIGVGREVIGRRKDGRLFSMDLSISEVRLRTGRVFTGFVRDVSERQELEQAVTLAAENERVRIARELHDGLGQQLGGLLYLMNGLRRDLKSMNSPQEASAGRIYDELSAALTQARRLAHELYALPPNPEGLMEALENLAEHVTAERGVACKFDGEASVLVHDQSVASHLYRIAQEAVHNALKHSRATQIHIKLARHFGRVKLSVLDDGIGLPTQTVPSGLGLRTMAQRVRIIGGELTVHTRHQGGVEVLCLAPDRAFNKSKHG